MHEIRELSRTNMVLDFKVRLTYCSCVVLAQVCGTQDIILLHFKVGFEFENGEVSLQGKLKLKSGYQSRFQIAMAT